MSIIAWLVIIVAMLVLTVVVMAKDWVQSGLGVSLVCGCFVFSFVGTIALGSASFCEPIPTCTAMTITGHLKHGCSASPLIIA